mmetsp:Transcript_56706/g.133090  ORF Transcript_56706/g.133090 Transcript_56706/m.133090 type:complete len:208 (+) Transcript_56706:40-663(+)
MERPRVWRCGSSRGLRRLVLAALAAGVACLAIDLDSVAFAATALQPHRGSSLPRRATSGDVQGLGGGTVSLAPFEDPAQQDPLGEVGVALDRVTSSQTADTYQSVEFFLIGFALVATIVVGKATLDQQWAGNKDEELEKLREDQEWLAQVEAVTGKAQGKGFEEPEEEEPDTPKKGAKRIARRKVRAKTPLDEVRMQKKKEAEEEAK